MGMMSFIWETPLGGLLQLFGVGPQLHRTDLESHEVSHIDVGDFEKALQGAVGFQAWVTVAHQAGLWKTRTLRYAISSRTD